MCAMNRSPKTENSVREVLIFYCKTEWLITDDHFIRHIVSLMFAFLFYYLKVFIYFVNQSST